MLMWLPPRPSPSSLRPQPGGFDCLPGVRPSSSENASASAVVDPSAVAGADELDASEAIVGPRHRRSRCRNVPCKFLRTPRGCKDGPFCVYCHTCVWKHSMRVRRPRVAAGAADELLIHAVAPRSVQSNRRSAEVIAELVRLAPQHTSGEVSVAFGQADPSISATTETVQAVTIFPPEPVDTHVASQAQPQVVVVFSASAGGLWPEDISSEALCSPCGPAADSFDEEEPVAGEEQPRRTGSNRPGTTVVMSQSARRGLRNRKLYVMGR